MSRITEGATELAALIQSFCALSECALRACDSADDAALAGALDGRDLVTRRLTPILREMLAERRAAQGDAARGEIDRLLLAVRRGAEEARQINDKLEARAHTARVNLGAQLARLSHDDSARSAYAAAGAAEKETRLDLRR